jgi:integral membrane protein
LPAVLRALRIAAIVEAGTYLVLLLAVADHRLLGERDLVGPAGMLHGVVFLVYLGLVLQVARERSWPPTEVVTLAAAAFIPFGTVAAERRMAVADRPTTPS